MGGILRKPPDLRSAEEEDSGLFIVLFLLTDVQTEESPRHWHQTGGQGGETKEARGLEERPEERPEMFLLGGRPPASSSSALWF